MTTRILSRAALLLSVLYSVPAPAQPVLVVQEFGEAPYRELRYRFTAGATSEATMSMSMQMTVSRAGQQMPGTSAPTIHVPVSVRTTEVRPDGSARLAFEMSAPGTSGGSLNTVLDQALATSLSPIGESSGWYWIDTRGTTLEAGFNLPTGTDNPAIRAAGQMVNEMQGQIQQLSAPFPAEAVGVGARWQVSSSVMLSGTPVTQTTEYRLLSHEGDKVELGLEVTQVSAARNVTGSGVPPQAGATLGIQGSGSGTMTIDLDNMVQQSEITTNSNMSMDVQMQGQSQNMSMAMQMTMSITPN